MARRLKLLRLTTCALALWAAPSVAQEVDDATRAAARQIGYVGVQAYESKDYATASEKLEKAFRVLQAPSLGLWSARALVKLNKLVEAQERYLKVTRLPIISGEIDVQKQAQADAANELSALVPRVPTVIIQIEGVEDDSPVALSIDGAAVSPELVGEARPVNPGSHQILAMRGAERVEVWLEIAEGEQKPALVRFPSPATAAAPAPAPAPVVTRPAPPAAQPVATAAPTADAGAGSTRRTLAWVTIGVGAAAFVVGGVSGAVALSKRDAFHSNDACAGTACGPSQQDKVDSYNALRTVSGLGLISGTVIAAAGVTLLLTMPRASHGPGPSAALFFSPGLSGIQGSF